MPEEMSMDRKEKIWTARQNCLKKLERRDMRYTSQQERQEKKTKMQFDSERSSEQRNTFGIRLVLGILFFLFVFLSRENDWRYGDWDYQMISENISENGIVEQMEQQAEEVFLQVEETE